MIAIAFSIILFCLGFVAIAAGEIEAAHSAVIIGMLFYVIHCIDRLLMQFDRACGSEHARLTASDPKDYCQCCDKTLEDIAE